MTGEETARLLGAYRDGELSPGEVLDMERRLAADPTLRGAAARLDRACDTVRETLGATPVPPGLEARVLSRLPAPARPAGRGAPATWRPMAAAASIALVVGLLAGSGAAYWILRASVQGVGEAVLTAHLRALAAPQPFDVASSDRHVVKPWFNGRTPLAPSAPDLADQGFPLVGGRIDVVGERPVPTLVYRRARHVISVTVVPQQAAGGPAETRRDGSTLERWSAQDLDYWTVSDLDAKELRRFAALFRARAAPPPAP